MFNLGDIVRDEDEDGEPLEECVRCGLPFWVGDHPNFPTDSGLCSSCFNKDKDQEVSEL